MSARVNVVVGPARSGKTEHLLARYRKHLATVATSFDAVASTLWLAPSLRAVEQVRERLLDGALTGCFSPTLRTFDQLAADVLAHAAADRDIRPIDDRMKRLLIERLLREATAAGRLKHFSSIAATPGFLDLASEFISELKRVEIWPEELAAACGEAGRGGAESSAGKTLSRKDRELVALYEGYQKQLLSHKLYDAEGRFWSARELLCQGQRRPLDRLRLVVVDGFTDFSRTQHEILEELARRAETVWISLPDEAETQRSELFGKPRRTLAELGRRHPEMALERLPRRAAPRPSALDHVEREIFKSPRIAAPAPSLEDVEIIDAAGAIGEIEELARRVKRLLVDGESGSTPSGPVPPDDIVIVFRSPEDVAPLVREIFTRYGIPTAIETGRRLDQSPSLTALTALLELDRDDWSYRRLLAVTGSNFFDPTWPEWRRAGAREAVERTIRHLQVPSGREALVDAVDRLAETPPPAPAAEDDPHAEAAEEIRRRVRQAKLAAGVLKKLAAALDRLPSRASTSDWSTALDELARETGLWRSLHEVAEHPLESRPPGDLATDRMAWARFHDGLRSADRLADLLAEGPPRLERREAAQLAADVIRREQLPGDHDETGRVRVLSAITARSITAPYLFVAGLTEKSFPPPEPSGRLYDELDYQRLARAGLPLPLSSDRRSDEMLLFYETITRAERRLFLSYSAINEKAEPLLPSPYLAELDRACGAGRLPRHIVHDLSPVPPADALLNRFDLPVRATAAAAQGNLAELAAVIRRGDEASRRLVDVLRVIDERSRGDGFGPYEGVIEGAAARKLLERRFGGDYSWSAGQFEQYGACPFQFFLDRILKLRPLEDVTLEVDHRRRGSRMHRALASLHQELVARFGPDCVPAGVPPAGYEGLIAELLTLSEAARNPHPLGDAFDEIDRRLLERMLRDYVGQHTRYDKGYEKFDQPARARHFETSFGLPNPPDDGVSTSTPLEITLADERIRITGRIDRIDVGTVAGRAVFAIVDYKTGAGSRYRKGDVLSGRVLQLTLYAVAAQRLMLHAEGTLPWHFGYWFVADGGFKKMLALHELEGRELKPSAAWQELHGRIVERVVSLARGIRGGEFPMFNTDEDCTSYCDFHTVCRVGQTRALEKTWRPPPAIPPR